MTASRDATGWAAELGGWTADGHPYFALTRRQKIASVLPLLVLCVGSVVVAVSFENPGGPVLLVVLAVMVAATVRRRTVLTPDELVVVAQAFGERRIPWASVTAIEVYRAKRALGGRLLRVHEQSGRRTTLLAPVPGGFDVPADPQFDAKVAAIREWWMLHRGPQWTGDPARPATDTDPYARP